MDLSSRLFTNLTAAAIQVFSGVRYIMLRGGQPVSVEYCVSLGLTIVGHIWDYVSTHAKKTHNEGLVIF